MKQKIILLLSSLFICLILTEITLTILIQKDLDNNLKLNNLHLKPFQLPVLETKQKLDKLFKSNYNNNYQNVRLIPDSTLGWAPNPHYADEKSIYKYNSVGIRTNRTIGRTTDKAKLTIAIFGDSYTHGDEVDFENTISNLLENILEQNGIVADVLNFAVSGYGIDQAYLKWQMINESIKPDIIILGVQFENVKRHINILRPFYYHITDIPYSKPRFILKDRKLQLLDNPIKNVNEIINVIKNIDDLIYSKHEGFYIEENYKASYWDNFKIYSSIKSLADKIKAEFGYYSPNSESYQITKKLFHLFKNSTIESDQLFIPVHLPTMDDFDFVFSTYLKYFHSKHFIYDELFTELKRETQFVETFDKLETWSSGNNSDKLFMKRHYSPIANKIIAAQIYSFLSEKYSHLLNK